jgi:hypothetical protein
MNTNVRFRRAQESDASDLICLIDSASRGLVKWLWSTLRGPGQTTTDVGRNRIRTHAASPLYYGAFTVAEIDGAVAGALAGRFRFPTNGVIPPICPRCSRHCWNWRRSLRGPGIST